MNKISVRRSDLCDEDKRLLDIVLDCLNCNPDSHAYCIICSDRILADPVYREAHKNDIRFIRKRK